ncbi:hypothetical protein BY996DRAFT_6416371 [Phakopsora pachyrhizi]|nr:hypothetical protein BY996DRAFT_6416371 [Phakopsora pachyrhizi]
MKPGLTHSSFGSNQTTPRPSEQPIKPAAKPLWRPSTSDGALSPGTASQHELALFLHSPDSSPHLKVLPKLGSSVSGLSIRKDQGSRGGVYGLPIIEHGDQNSIGGGTSNNMFKNLLSLATQQELAQSQSSFSRPDEDKAMRTVKSRASNIQPQRSVLKTPPAAVDSLLPRPLRSGSSGGERPFSYYDPELQSCKRINQKGPHLIFLESKFLVKKLFGWGKKDEKDDELKSGISEGYTKFKRFFETLNAGYLTQRQFRRETIEPIL